VSSAIAFGDGLKQRQMFSGFLCRDFATSISSDAAHDDAGGGRMAGPPAELEALLLVHPRSSPPQS
jgi:hypothetical protein